MGFFVRLFRQDLFQYPLHFERMFDALVYDGQTLAEVAKLLEQDLSDRREASSEWQRC